LASALVVPWRNIRARRGRLSATRSATLAARVRRTVDMMPPPAAMIAM